MLFEVFVSEDWALKSFQRSNLWSPFWNISQMSAFISWITHCWWSRLNLSLTLEIAVKIAFGLLSKSSCKKHHPRRASCCLRVGQQLLQSQCRPQRGDLCPAECWTSGKWRCPAAVGPGWSCCCCHKSGCECCTSAGERQHFLHQAGTETRSGSVLLRRDNNISQMAVSWILRTNINSDSWIFSVII